MIKLVFRSDLVNEYQSRSAFSLSWCFVGHMCLTGISLMFPAFIFLSLNCGRDGGCDHGPLSSSGGVTLVLDGMCYFSTVSSVCDFMNFSAGSVKRGEPSARRAKTSIDKSDRVHRSPLRWQTFSSVPLQAMVVSKVSMYRMGAFSFFSSSLGGTPCEGPRGRSRWLSVLLHRSISRIRDHATKLPTKAGFGLKLQVSCGRSRLYTGCKGQRRTLATERLECLIQGVYLLFFGLISVLAIFALIRGTQGHFFAPHASRVANRQHERRIRTSGTCVRHWPESLVNCSSLVVFYYAFFSRERLQIAWFLMFVGCF